MSTNENSQGADDFEKSLTGIALNLALFYLIAAGPGTLCLFLAHTFISGDAGMIGGLVSGALLGGAIGHKLEDVPERKYYTSSVFALSNLMLGAISFSIIQNSINPAMCTTNNSSCDSVKSGMGGLGTHLVMPAFVTKKVLPVRKAASSAMSAARHVLQNG